MDGWMKFNLYITYMGKNIGKNRDFLNLFFILTFKVSKFCDFYN